MNGLYGINKSKEKPQVAMKSNIDGSFYTKSLCDENQVILLPTFLWGSPSTRTIMNAFDCLSSIGKGIS